jgi:hypothetical protein
LEKLQRLVEARRKRKVSPGKTAFPATSDTCESQDQETAAFPF